MSKWRSLSGIASLLLVVGVANAAEFVCPIETAPLPHESWSDIRAVSNDELYRRVREGVSHWSWDREWLLAVRFALYKLLEREPEQSRGYVELARFAMFRGYLGEGVLAEEAYDTAARALELAIEFDYTFAPAWALEAVFREHRRGWGGHPGNDQSSDQALELAKRYGAQLPEVALARAQWHAIRFEFDESIDAVEQLLAMDGLSDELLGSSYRELAEIYIDMDRRGAAIRAAQDAVEVEPGNPMNWIALSDLELEQLGDSERALASARTAYCIDESSGAANQRVAYALYVAWAQDNVGIEQAALDDERIIEAFERYPDVSGVIKYMVVNDKLESLVEAFALAGLSLDVEAGLQNGINLLHWAVRDGNIADAEWLLKLGADVNRQGDDYGTFLSEAVRNRDPRMVRLLLEHGADVNANPPKQGPVLVTSMFAQHEKIIEMLLEAGADTELANFNGEKALQIAVFGIDDPKKRFRVVRLLLDAGANPDIEIVPGMPIIEPTVEYGYADVAELIRQASEVRSRQ